MGLVNIVWHFLKKIYTNFSKIGHSFTNSWLLFEFYVHVSTSYSVCPALYQHLSSWRNVFVTKERSWFGLLYLALIIQSQSPVKFWGSFTYSWLLFEFCVYVSTLYNVCPAICQHLSCCRNVFETKERSWLGLLYLALIIQSQSWVKFWGSFTSS